MRHACWAVWGENNNKIKFVGEITVFCYPQTVEKAQFPQQKPRKTSRSLIPVKQRSQVSVDPLQIVTLFVVISINITVGTL
jgi:hypothetical protein